MRHRVTLTTDLLDCPSEPTLNGGSLNYAAELRCALSEALKKSPKSRFEIAARMSELTGQEISKAMLDSWTAESRSPWRFPFEYAAAFESACETTALQDLLARKRGRAVLSMEELLVAKLGLVKKQQSDLAEQEKAIRRHLGKKR